MKNRRKVNEFYIGLLIITIVSTYIINKSILYSGAFLGLTIGKFSFYSILMVIPAFIGGLMFFYNKKSIIAKVLSLLGGLLLIVSIITCITITLGKYSILQYILLAMFLAIGIFFIIISFINKENKNVK